MKVINKSGNILFIVVLIVVLTEVGCFDASQQLDNGRSSVEGGVDSLVENSNVDFHMSRHEIVYSEIDKERILGFEVEGEKISENIFLNFTMSADNLMVKGAKVKFLKDGRCVVFDMRYFEIPSFIFKGNPSIDVTALIDLSKKESILQSDSLFGVIFTKGPTDVTFIGREFHFFKDDYRVAKQISKKLSF